jgi:hypothetical protein
MGMFAILFNSFNFQGQRNRWYAVAYDLFRSLFEIVYEDGMFL